MTERMGAEASNLRCPMRMSLLRGDAPMERQTIDHAVYLLSQVFY